MKNEHSQNLAAIVDRLGVLAAASAEIDNEVKALKAELILAGVPAIEGDLYRAAVSHCAGREVIAWKAIAEHFKPSRQLITAHTENGAPYSVVRVSARKGAK
jgi:hypothetical protein